jgi:cation-transporting P-type ATPase I
VLATVLGSAGLLVTVVQTPGVSHFFGCRPLGPLGWATGVGAATLATAGGTVWRAVPPHPSLPERVEPVMTIGA